MAKSITLSIFISNYPGQPRDLDNRPNLDGTFARHGNPPGDAKGFVEILGLDQKVTAQLFACLGKRPIGHHRLPSRTRTLVAIAV